MVDVGEKDTTQRMAKASGKVMMSRETLEMVEAGNAKKGDVISVARIAGIMAAKKTSDLIPLCHPIGVTSVSVEIEPDASLPGLIVEAIATVSDKTGVEMEAMTACAIACLTIYDMVKGVDRGVEVTEIALQEKRGGKSGIWKRPAKA